jgi:precorrin-3B synthase
MLPSFAEGPKRRQFGKVDVPHEAFIEALEMGDSRGLTPKLPISPLVGEMSGRTERGAKERLPIHIL